MKNPEPLFAAIRTIAGPLNQREVDLINAAIIAAQKEPAPAPTGTAKTTAKTTGKASGKGKSRTGRDVTPDGIKRLHAREGCRLTAYPDPGSRDGTPWTIGYGATGPGIHKGVIWTQEQADARFAADLRRFEDQVERVLGDTPTNPHQFDALVSFAYNVGVNAFAKSTLLRKHREKHYRAAADQFARWVNNDGRRMPGLVNRRRGEAAQYQGLSA